MGYAIAEELAQSGGKGYIGIRTCFVINITQTIQVIPVESAEEMYEASASHFMDCDGAVLTAAVADYTPAQP
jgi:phosphopantothenoylcysteine decarboxylase / phosphopantothenate---cysteine ligase